MSQPGPKPDPKKTFHFHHDSDRVNVDWDHTYIRGLFKVFYYLTDETVDGIGNPWYLAGSHLNARRRLPRANLCTYWS